MTDFYSAFHWAEKARKYAERTDVNVNHVDVNAFTKRFLVYSDKKQLTILKNTIIRLEVDGIDRYLKVGTDTPIDVIACLDTGSALVNGRDYYVYIVPGATEDEVLFKVSYNSTYPVGYTADNSRKIGGFHTLCMSVTAANAPQTWHPLIGFNSGDILPRSVWCLTHRPFCNPEGMTYIPNLNFWCDIYLQSGTDSATKSMYNGTVTDSRQPYLHTWDMIAVNKQLLSDSEFAIAAEGSNQRTNIAGSVAPNPKTTGGHLDTAGKRMVSSYGCEDICGYLWQWLRENAACGGANWTSQVDKGDYYGSIYVLRAGGSWAAGGHCGSFARSGDGPRSVVGASCGGRGRSENI